MLWRCKLLTGYGVLELNYFRVDDCFTRSWILRYIFLELVDFVFFLLCCIRSLRYRYCRILLFLVMMFSNFSSLFSNWIASLFVIYITNVTLLNGCWALNEVNFKLSNDSIIKYGKFRVYLYFTYFNFFF